MNGAVGYLFGRKFMARERIVRWNGRKVFKAESGEIPFDDITGKGINLMLIQTVKKCQLAAHKNKLGGLECLRGRFQWRDHELQRGRSTYAPRRRYPGLRSDRGK